MLDHFWEAQIPFMANRAIDITSVVKIFNEQSDHPVHALRGVSLDIDDNEFFTLLGPSGCGKTTLLRLIAGFEQASAGEIRLFSQRIEKLPPHRRSINTVFQHYALFPHMSVQENVAFGLQMLGKKPKDIDATVMQVLELVKMESFAQRKPGQLSGGQQQRVALARALAPKPKVLLLDEPLSALDLKLRQAMRSELKTLQRETGVTFIFVTHDQEEALTMSDRIAVMSEGEVQQVGSPSDIYENPVNRFVADFIGRSNFVAATVRSKQGDSLEVSLSDGSMLEVRSHSSHHVGEEVTLVLRPEKISLRPGDSPDVPLASPQSVSQSLQGSIYEAMYLGTDTSYHVRLPDGTLLEVRDQNGLLGSARFRVGDSVILDIAPQAARVIQG